MPRRDAASDVAPKSRPRRPMRRPVAVGVFWSVIALPPHLTCAGHCRRAVHAALGACPTTTGIGFQYQKSETGIEFQFWLAHARSLPREQRQSRGCGMSKVAVAVIGTGAIGRAHCETIRRSESCRLAAIAEPAAAGKTYAESLGV